MQKEGKKVYVCVFVCVCVGGGVKNKIVSRSGNDRSRNNVESCFASCSVNIFFFSFSKRGGGGGGRERRQEEEKVNTRSLSLDVKKR